MRHTSLLSAATKTSEHDPKLIIIVNILSKCYATGNYSRACACIFHKILGLMLYLLGYDSDTRVHVPLQLVDRPLIHPQDLEDMDQTLYHTLTTLQDDIIDGWFIH